MKHGQALLALLVVEPMVMRTLACLAATVSHRFPVKQLYKEAKTSRRSSRWGGKKHELLQLQSNDFTLFWHWPWLHCSTWWRTWSCQSHWSNHGNISPSSSWWPAAQVYRWFSYGKIWINMTYSHSINISIYIYIYTVMYINLHCGPEWHNCWETVHWSFSAQQLRLTVSQHFSYLDYSHIFWPRRWNVARQKTPERVSDRFASKKRMASWQCGVFGYEMICSHLTWYIDCRCCIETTTCVRYCFFDPPPFCCVYRLQCLEPAPLLSEPTPCEKRRAEVVSSFDAAIKVVRAGDRSPRPKSRQSLNPGTTKTVMFACLPLKLETVESVAVTSPCWTWKLRIRIEHEPQNIWRSIFTYEVPPTSSWRVGGHPILPFDAFWCLLLPFVSFCILAFVQIKMRLGAHMTWFWLLHA